MRIGVVTLMPEMLSAVTEYGVTGRAVKNGILEVMAYNPRDYTSDVHRTVDDRPYGGGPGMIMKYEPVMDAIGEARREMPEAKVIYLSPQGKCLDQGEIAELSTREGIILLAGRYEGIDERVIVNAVDEEFSIGDYVLSGGELPAMVLIDAISRAIPGVLGHEDSARQDSFFDGLLDSPHYTRPETAGGIRAPEILLSGDHEGIQRWRMKQALGRTWLRRPDLLERLQLSNEQKVLLDEFISENEKE